MNNLFMKIIIVFLVCLFIWMNNSYGFEYKEYNSIEWYTTQKYFEFTYLKWDYFTKINNTLNTYSDAQLEEISLIMIKKSETVNNLLHKDIYSEVWVLIDWILDKRNNINIVKDIEYASWAKNKIDMYLTNQMNAPLIVYVHGGAWKIWDKENDIQKGKYFAENGYNFATINYTLSPDADYKQQISELAQAFKFLKNNSEILEIDAENTYFMGHSAGGYLVTMLWVDESYLTEVWLKASDMKKIISLDAWWYDINKVKENSKGQFLLVYKSVFWINEENLRKASAINYINSQNIIPQFEIFASTSRWEIHDEIQQDFYTAINNSGNWADIHLYDFSHEDFNKNIWDDNFHEYWKKILSLMQ